MSKYRANEHALPISVRQIDDVGWMVVTGLGLPVGDRLLKGKVAPNISDWGPFDNEEDAVRLSERLTRHIEEWPVKKKKR